MTHFSGRWRRSTSRRIDPLTKHRLFPWWVFLILALAIGGQALLGIEAISSREKQALQAEIAAGRIKTLSVQAQNLYQQYLIDPTNAERISAQYEATLSQVILEMQELGKLGPGAEFEQLTSILNRLLVAAAQDPAKANPTNGATLDDTYLNEVMLPIANEFIATLDGAQVVYRDEARQQEQRARTGTIFVFTITGVLLTALFAINERLRRSKSLLIERQELRFRAFVQHGTDLITLVDKTGTILYQSPSISGLLGRTMTSVDHGPFELLVHPGDITIYQTMLHQSTGRPESVYTAELRLLHVDGSYRTVEIVTSNLLDNPAVGGFVLTSRDVTLRNELTEQIAHAAMHDQLTGLPNRRLLLDRLTQGLARSNRTADHLTVIFSDLDRFKAVNDTFGHDAGDDLLRMAARRILNSIRPGDTLARLGGDEFVVLLESTRTDQALEVAERLSEAISTPFKIDGHDVQISISLGIAERNGPFDEPEDLLRRADAAMYVSKRDGHAEPFIYDASMAPRSDRSFSLIESSS